MAPRKPICLAVVLASLSALALSPSPAAAQRYTAPTDLSTVKPAKLSAHVYEIEGYPNVGIVVGAKAVLVVDTGLGPKNGATVAKTAMALAPAGAKLYLTTTHYHREHTSGDSGFPADTVLIRNKVQQDELLANVDDTMRRGRADPASRPWLEGVVFRTPDVLFDDSYALDLGGVHVRLLSDGGGHTVGDEVIFVEEDRLAMTGDVVQNKAAPVATILQDTSPRRWLAAIAKVAALKPLIVMPDHSPPGGPELIVEQTAFLQQLDMRARQLKAQGAPAKAAAATITAEMKARYPDWMMEDQTIAVGHVYAEAP